MMWTKQKLQNILSQLLVKLFKTPRLRANSDSQKNFISPIWYHDTTFIKASEICLWAAHISNTLLQQPKLPEGQFKHPDNGTK